MCLAGMLAAVNVAFAEEPPARHSFGIRPEAASSPAMLDAMVQLRKAGEFAGRRGSLTFFRWSSGEPSRLAHLGLWGPQVRNEHILLTEHLSDLELVSLYETDVNDDGLQQLKHLTKLRRLAISPICRYEKADFGPPQWSYPFVPERQDRPRISGRGLRAFTSLAGLENLELLDARLTTEDLSLLKSWPKLSAVALPNQIDDEAIRHLQACPRLNHLTLGYREVHPSELEQLAGWPRLSRLTLIHARLSDEALAAFGKLQSLEELRLQDCGLTDDRLRQLQLGASTSTLLLDRNEIDGPGLAHLAKFSVQVLGLEFNNIADETLVHLPQLSTVSDLRLAYCRLVTDRGLDSGVLQGMHHVKRLNLRGLKKVTDRALDSLEELRHLEHIGLRETSVSPDGIARLRRTLPQTDVFK
jgi:hypothetical protein